MLAVPLVQVNSTCAADECTAEPSPSPSPSPSPAPSPQGSVTGNMVLSLEEEIDLEGWQDSEYAALLLTRLGYQVCSGQRSISCQ